MSQTDGEGKEAGMGDGVIHADRGPDRMEMLHDYLPEEDQWEAKTQLDLNDPAALGALSQFGEMYPEVDDLQIVIDGFLEKYLPAKTSVNNLSRQEYKEILMSMFGKSGSEHGSSVTLKALGVDEDE